MTPKCNHIKRTALLLILIFVPAVMLMAASESYVQTLSGKIKKGDSCVVVDDKFLHMSLARWNQVKNLSVQNMITFELRQDTSYYYQVKPFTCTLQLSIKYYTSRDQTKPAEINDVKLVVKYDTASGVSYPVVDRYKFSNAFKVVIVVKSISSPEWGDKLPPVFRVTNQIFTERKYPFDSSWKIPVTIQKITKAATSVKESAESAYDIAATFENDITATKSANKVLLSWPFLNPDPVQSGEEEMESVFEEYDVEWTFIDVRSEAGQYLNSLYGNETTDGPYYISSPQIEEWMRNNTTRVTVNTTYYSINLPYPEGFVFFRIRGVTYPESAYPTFRYTSSWVYQKEGNSQPEALCVHLHRDGEVHRPDLNWQYTGSFAEQGKRKEVVSYFDASLRNRQTVTINNADNKAIAAETIYDKMGRAALQILPAPLNSDRLDYFERINLNTDGAPYNYTNIKPVNLSNAACSIAADPIQNFLPANSGPDPVMGGASVYYSPNNVFLPGATATDHFFTQYIPDAQGTPFSLTEYTPDNTGRVRRQGGVGPNFQIGSGHETRYYYSKPLQEELDRLFGTEAGIASHYLKTMVIDPNNQASVTYANSSGKTVATALIGDAPAALDKLTSAEQSAIEQSMIFIRPADFQRDAGALQMQAAATFTVAKKGTFSLFYSVNPAAITTSPSTAAAFCSNCYYDMLVEVKNECGLALRTVVSQPFSGSNIVCSASTTEVTGSFDMEDLLPGEYYVTYTLRLSESQIQFHEDYYINHNKDLKQLQAFLTEELARIDISSCYSECTTCKEKLGSEQDFAAKMQALLVVQKAEKFPDGSFELDLNSAEITSWIHTTYQNLSAQCQAMSSNCTTTSPCEDKLQIMKQDVLPGGQYALYDPATFALVERAVNVMVHYTDTGFANLSFQNEDGITVYASSLSEADFVKAYIAHPEWADEFVKKHIEYCSYLWCVGNTYVYSYEDKMNNVVTRGGDAESLGYFNRNNIYALLNNDPFFSTGNVGASYKTAMQSDLASFSNVMGISVYDASSTQLPGKNILQLIDWTLYCKPSDSGLPADVVYSWQNCSPAMACRSKTREWEMYRDYYFQLRSKYIHTIKQNNGCINCFIGTDGVGGVSITCQPLNGGEQPDPGPCPQLSDFYQEERNVNEWWTNNFHTYHKTCDIYVVYGPGNVNRKVTLGATHSVRLCAQCSDDYPWEYGVDMAAGTHEAQVGSYTLISPDAYPGNEEFYEESNFLNGSIQCLTPTPTGNSSSYCISDSRYPDYKNKTRVFNEFIDLTPLKNCIASRGNSSSLDQSLRDAALTDLSALKENWLNTLKGVRDEEFPGYSGTGQALHDNNLAVLVDRLYEVSKKNIQIATSDIRAASTLPPSTFSIYNHNSFQDAFTAVIGSSLMNQGFNEHLLAQPYPWDKKPQTSNPNISEVTTAICNNISGFKSRWVAAGTPATFHEYLKQELGDDYILTETELADIENKCAASCAVRLLENPVLLPVAFTTPVSAAPTCTVVNSAISAFQSNYSAIPVGGKLYRNLLANYLNHLWGYSLSYDEYIAFNGKACTDNANALLYNKALSPLIKEDDFACATGLVKDAFAKAGQEYEYYVVQERKKFRNNYISTCLANQASAKLKSAQREYHYTLYYYDQAGNLVKTIPPAGVAFLEGEDLAQVETFRGDDAEACLEYNGPGTENKIATLTDVSTQLSANVGKAMELWLYNVNNENFTRQVRFNTPDHRYFYQLAIHDNKIWVELYSMEPDSQGGIAINQSNQAYADLSTIPRPLQSWTHIMVQSATNTLTSGDDLQLYVDGEKLTTLRTGPSMPPYPFEWAVEGENALPAEELTSLKQLRLYRRAATDAEVWANYKNQCLTPRDLLANAAAVNPQDIQSYPLTVWGRFNVPAEGSETTIAGNIEWAGRMILPKHTLPTVYTYNSLNQVVKQTTPDAGTSDFFYDRLGRLVASQNAEQKSPQLGATNDNPANRFSYTRYDNLGRITETGERLGTSIAMTEELARNPSADPLQPGLGVWMQQGTSRQVTLTAYDQAPSWVPNTFTQRNLRKRVAATALLSSGADGAVNREAASYYSYDVSGNVDVLVQENAKLKQHEQQYVPGSSGLKTIEYDYDLVSGKVNKVKYQRGRYDQFFYSYRYDAENRLIEALSGRDELALSLDARYTYYLHGPLARVELGKNKVQGIDYAYTLQGWLKGVNGQFLDPSKEMGSDGLSSYSIHQDIARDALAFSLGYYDGDYVPIGSGAPAFAKTYNSPELIASTQSGKSLFNGNISYSTYAIRKLNGSGGTPGTTVANTYRYDQLNRLTAMIRQNDLSNDINPWSNGDLTNLQAYREAISYDANGNINSYLRNGPDHTNPAMDNLTYTYAAGKNQLSELSDQGDGAANLGDIKGTTSYNYDKIGNLISETNTSSGNTINNIAWTVYGKIAGITRSGINIDYGYDAGGNRITKTINTESTHYVRDAQGNILGVYKYANGGWEWQEQHLYGSSRLGMLTPRRSSLTSPFGSYNYDNQNDHTEDVGNRLFELSNHLGNVLATVSDRKIPCSSNGTTIDYYNADVVSAQDYYPFGMIQPGRSYNAGGYRYGFNGKENDNEVKGEGNQQDYGMRIYDPRIGKFLSVDPITNDYPELTPYQFASNRPIQGVDLDGLEFKDQATAMEHWLRTQPLQTLARGVQQTAPQAAHNTPVKVIPTKANNAPPASERHIVEWNQYREHGQIGRESVVTENIAIAKSNYYAAIGANIAGGAFGAAGYYVGGESGSNVGSAFDGIVTSFAGIPGGGYLSRPGGVVPETYAAYTEISINAGIPKKGMNNPVVRAAANLGNKVHYDQLNGGPAGSVALPTELSARYPNTEFNFAPRGAAGPDVRVSGGMHPSQYPGSTWSPENAYGDFKPATPSGNRTFKSDVKSGKFPQNTQHLKYDPKTGKLQ